FNAVGKGHRRRRQRQQIRSIPGRARRQTPAGSGTSFPACPKKFRKNSDSLFIALVSDYTYVCKNRYVAPEATGKQDDVPTDSRRSIPAKTPPHTTRTHIRNIRQDKTLTPKT